MKVLERDEARRLRKEEGLSLKRIANQLNVAKSSVSVWVRDIELTDDQIQKLVDSNSIRIHQLRGGYSRQNKALELRKKYQDNGRQLAKKRKDDALFIAGCMLYFAEGGKGRNSVKLANTDEYLLCYWIRFLKEIFDIVDEQFSFHISCYLNNGLTVNDIEYHWVCCLGLPYSCVRKTTVVTKHKMSEGKKKGKCPYGTCTINVHNTEIVQTIFGAINEITGYIGYRWIN